MGSWGTVSFSVADLAIAEAPPWLSLSHRKSRLPGILPLGKASIHTGHWALVLEALARGDALCFSAGEHTPLPGLAQGHAGQGELAGRAEEAGPVPCSFASWVAGPAAAWTS